MLSKLRSQTETYEFGKKTSVEVLVGDRQFSARFSQSPQELVENAVVDKGFQIVLLSYVDGVILQNSRAVVRIFSPIQVQVCL